MPDKKEESRASVFGEGSVLPNLGNEVLRQASTIEGREDLVICMWMADGDGNVCSTTNMPPEMLADFVEFIYEQHSAGGFKYEENRRTQQ